MPEAKCRGEKWWARERVVTLYRTLGGEIIPESAQINYHNLVVHGYAIERRLIPGVGEWRMDESTIMPKEREVRLYGMPDGDYMLDIEMPDGFFTEDMSEAGTATAVFDPETWSYELVPESFEWTNP